VTIGVNDLPWNRPDYPCPATPDPTKSAAWKVITPGCIRGVVDNFRNRLDALLNDIHGLRSGKPTALRLTTVYNDWVAWPQTSRAAVAPLTLGHRLFATNQCETVLRTMAFAPTHFTR
jgi:hypothetical protein